VVHFDADDIDCWLRSGSFWGWWYWLFVKKWLILRLVIYTVCWRVVHFEAGDADLESGSFWGWWYWLLPFFYKLY